MNSSISHFSWVGLAVAGFVAIEATISWWAPRPEHQRSNFLEYAFAKTESVQRAFVMEKVSRFDDARPDIIQVGDSSGLHAVQSPIVESYLGGRSFLNLSVASNLGYPGYYALARRIMERSGSVKVLVLYFTPGGGAPREALLNAKDIMGPDLQREFASPFNRLFHVPSLGLRKEVTDSVFYLNGRLNQTDRPLVSNPGYLMLRDIIGPSGGWARETDIPDDHINGLFQMVRRNSPPLAGYSDDELAQYYGTVAGVAGVPSMFDWKKLSRRTYIEVVLDQYLALAREHGARLVVATNPMPQAFQREVFQKTFDTRGVARELAAYAARHADVSILNIDYWPDDQFSVFSHVGTPYAVASSKRVGEHLAGLIGQLPPVAAPVQPFRNAGPVNLEMAASPTVYGFSDSEKVGSRVIRRIRPGRFEALAFARSDSEKPQELRIATANAADDPVLKTLGVAIYGVKATRLPDITEGDRHWVRFALPESETRRYNGWLEILLSTRGAATWQGDALHADATGPTLMIERIEIGPPAAPLQN